MSGYTFSETPPTHWDATCERTAALFHSRDWQALLEQSFRCQSLYAWNAESGSGAALSVFKAGPFHIAYLGFPVGGMLGNVLTDDASLLAWGKHATTRMPTCVRIAVSAFADPIDLPLAFESNPETAISHLQDWDLASVSKNLRRDVKKAQRSDLTIVEPSGAFEGKALFRIYRATGISGGYDGGFGGRWPCLIPLILLMTISFLRATDCRSCPPRSMSCDGDRLDFPWPIETCFSR